MTETRVSQEPRRSSDGKAAEVEALIAPALADLGYDIVRVTLGGERRAKLQLMIERLDGRPLDVEDCALASRAVEALLDVEDPISASYILEVSSPGVDRPLTRLSDFDRWKGFIARVELQRPYEGRRRFSGRLQGLEGETIVIADETGEIFRLPFAELGKAKLVLNDELLAAYTAQPTAVHPDEG